MRLPAFTQTIRFRLTIWYSSLLLVFGVAFVVALNVAVRLDRPQVVLFDTLHVPDIEWQPVQAAPESSVNGFVPVVSPGVIVQEAEAQIRSQNLDRLQTWSLGAVLALALASGVGGYIISGVMLRPIRDITQVASEISATNLARRIGYQGPEDELKRLADTFDSMIARLEDAFERQRRFVQDASHELRTPLAAIRASIEVAEMEAELTPEEYRELLETVKAQTERLTRLSEDLLLLTAHEGAELECEPVALCRLAEVVLREMEPLARRRGVALEADVPPGLAALAHPNHLHRSLMNLVDNAIKYGADGGRVVIGARREGIEAVLWVQDFGPGIPKEAQPRVFDRFYRVDRGRSRREGGSGLGLAIVAELVRAMGGEVRLHSQPGHGATFEIRLPAANEA
ncbi:Signal transduction histidine-protein kinase ArlS [bacterium HR29]|nr:Signal transduction histidine-protein kinase ArlS [bacterium HR29]